jgi:hypothetical protein
MRIPGTFQNITTDFACNEQLPVDASVDALLFANAVRLRAALHCTVCTVCTSGESNLRTRVRGFESFGDFRGRKKRFESLAKDSSLLGTCFLTKFLFLQPKNQELSLNLSFFLVL